MPGCLKIPKTEVCREQVRKCRERVNLAEVKIDWEWAGDYAASFTSTRPKLQSFKRRNLN